MHPGVVASAIFASSLFLAGPISAAPAPGVAEQLAAAKKAGRPAFLLVTEARVRGIDAMRSAVAAARERAPHVVLVEMDRSATVNRALVKRYGLAGARLPMVLVLAHNGAPGGGVTPGPKAEERLLALLPSPRKADTLLALFEQKAAFVLVGRPTMAGRTAAIAACHDAVGALKGKAAVIEVDLLDKAEQAFLRVLGADRKAQDVVVHVYGVGGRKTKAIKGAITSELLVKAATEKAECCPGGKCG